MIEEEEGELWLILRKGADDEMDYQCWPKAMMMTMIGHDQWPWTLRLPMMNDFQERRGWDGLLSNINDPQIFAGCISTNNITTSQIPKYVNNQFNIYHNSGSEWHLERTQQHSRPSHSQVNHQAWYKLIRNWSKYKTKIIDQFLLDILAAKNRKETLKVGSKLPNWWHHRNKKSDIKNQDDYLISKWHQDKETKQRNYR